MSSPLMCPSAPAQEGAVIVGIFVGRRLAFVQPAVPVSRDDLEGAGEALDERFRFSSPCVHGACHNYAGNRCGLIGTLLAKQSSGVEPATAAPSAELPNCVIRDACQWFRTAGGNACGVCPTVHRPLVRIAPDVHLEAEGSGL